MRLVLAVVQIADVEVLMRDFTELGVSATQIEGDTAVGRSGLAAIMVGTGDHLLNDVMTLVYARGRARSRRAEPLRPTGERSESWIPGPLEQAAGGASVFVLPIQRFERIGYA